MSKPTDSCDISPKRREVIEWKEARRLQLREKYLRDYNHPTKHYLLFDEGVQRFAAMRVTHEFQFKPAFKNFMLGYVPVMLLIGLTAYAFKKQKDNQEHLYRTGQISYADKPYKFT